MARPKMNSQPIPPARNTSAKYEVAAREIEQEKQMVAALKRLSIGHLMDLDPDIPVSDVSHSYFTDRDLSYEQEKYAERPYSPGNGAKHVEYPYERKERYANEQVAGRRSEYVLGPDIQRAPRPDIQHVSRPDIQHVSRPDIQHVSCPDIQHVSCPDAHGASSSNTQQKWNASSFETSPQHTECLEGPSPEEVLWVPANAHPEINPQNFRAHMKNTFDEMLERKLSRSKSAMRSKRSSLSLSTTDDHVEIDVSERHENQDLEETRRNRFSNPSLRRLTSELQTMSRLAGMDSTDAITLARSLSTTSLGYSEVERSAIDEIEQASTFKNNNSHAILADENIGQFQAGAYSPSDVSHLLPKMNSAERNGRNVLRSESPSRYAGNNTLVDGARPKYGDQLNEDFSLRRSRRLDYRKGPITSSVGSQLQSDKAGKLAQLRHRLSSSNLSALTTHERDRGKHADARASIQSINPRSSQVLFSVKAPSHISSPVQMKSFSYRNPSGHSQNTLKTSIQSRDSPYSTSPLQDPLEKNLQPTKYSHLNLTSKSLNKQSFSQTFNHYISSKTLNHHSSSKPVLKIRNPNSMPRMGQRSLSMTYEQSSNHVHYKPSNESLRVSSSGSGFRRSSPTSPHFISLPLNSSPRESPHSPQGSWPNHQGTQRYMPSNTITGRSPTQTHASMLEAGHITGYDAGNNDSGNIRLHKSTKTKDLNQNLNLLRNEINEFKDNLSTKAELPKQSKPVEPVQNLLSTNEDVPTDFSFDLSTEDVSYEDSLDLDLLTDLVTSEQLFLDKEDAFNVVAGDQNKEEYVLGPEKVESVILRNKDLVGAESDPFSINSNKSVSMELAENSRMAAKGVAFGSQNAKATPLSQSEMEQNTPIISITDTGTKTTKKSLYSPDQDTHAQNNEMMKRYLTEGGKRFNEQLVESASEISHTTSMNTEKKKLKKSWSWFKEKSARSKESGSGDMSHKENRISMRSVSTPEMLGTHNEGGKEHSITKFFKKRRSTSESHYKLERSPSRQSNISSEGEGDRQFLDKGKINRQSRHSNDDASSKESLNEEVKSEMPNEEGNQYEHKVSSRIKNRMKNMKSIHEGKNEIEKSSEPAEISVVENETTTQEDPRPKSTLEVQEKLKKAIKRHSKPNQPIEFTDSAFGFPLPPPSASTLVMIDYRFPVHVERAIYRLSHLKLANPKRSLREQVILSNFMYAYLNLVDHTLHLEQQMTSKEIEVDQPDGDLDFLGEQDVDTEFEAEDNFEDEFDSIKIDLDVSENQISV